MSEIILVVHAASTWWMVGLIWFVQIVHYPLFDGVGEPGWIRYATRHRSRTTVVVMPPMLVELATSVWLVIERPDLVAWIGAGLVGLIWLSTFALQVPLHGRLGRRFRGGDVGLLVWSNWIRTIAWSARGLLAASLLLDTRIA